METNNRCSCCRNWGTCRLSWPKKLNLDTITSCQAKDAWIWMCSKKKLPLSRKLWNCTQICIKILESVQRMRELKSWKKFHKQQTSTTITIRSATSYFPLHKYHSCVYIRTFLQLLLNIQEERINALVLHSVVPLVVVLVAPVAVDHSL